MCNSVYPFGEILFFAISNYMYFWNQIMGLDSATNGTNLDHIYKNAECLIICVSQKRLKCSEVKLK